MLSVPCKDWRTHSVGEGGNVPDDVSRHGMWSSRWLFVLAATGSAVGLGNIWKFPYITGENGGGAFVVVYLLCIAAIGIPIMMAEVMLGRSGRQSPINSMRSLIGESGGQRSWSVIGWMGVLAGVLILSFYAVIAGWAVFYVFRLASGVFEGVDGSQSSALFGEFLSNPWAVLLWQTLFMVATIVIVARGVARGLEVAVRWLMPILLLLLVGLVGYAAVYGDFGQGFAFLFSFDASKLTWDGTLTAMGHAFFTLSLGMGAIMAYGAYMPSKASISTTVVTIGVLDTVVALAAGLAIFPIVFVEGLVPGSGPGLMFETLPVAFGNLPFGAILGTIFFLLVSFAAITSAISLTEPALAFLVEEYNAKRWRVAISLGAVCWLLGIGTVLSFNVWADAKLFGLTFFDLVDYVSGKIMLPLGGLLIAVFAGWVLNRRITDDQLGFEGWRRDVWDLVIRFVAPAGVLVVFGYTIYQSFG
ncbi:MAG: sodium-dependent transporter [Gammaproteobacteria bacterium]|nr:sodium-dependent transporter [Gammaproteobacteria bacterium]